MQLVWEACLDAAVALRQAAAAAVVGEVLKGAVDRAAVLVVVMLRLPLRLPLQGADVAVPIVARMGAPLAAHAVLQVLTPRRPPWACRLPNSWCHVQVAVGKSRRGPNTKLDLISEFV